jgi:hypothetical protein
MGCFVVFRDTWLGFNSEFRGFGGEEGYIQKKYIRAGQSVYAMPGSRWWHRFGRPNGVKYQLSNIDKFRNYYIGWQELGLDTAPVVSHFVGSRLVTTQQAELMIRNGMKHDTPVLQDTKKPCGSCQTPTRVVGRDSADVQKISEVVEADIKEHIPTLRKLAEGAGSVLDIGSRVLSTLAFAESADTVVHFGALSTADVERINGLAEGSGAMVHGKSVKWQDTPKESFDIVFIDTDPHEYGQVLAQLDTYGQYSKRYIVLHDTTSFPSVMQAIAAWLRNNRRFTVIHHYENNNGLMVLSCNPEDKKAVPSVGRRVATFAKALGKFALSGGSLADEETYQRRLTTCDTCPLRNDSRCGACGCPVDKKASWASESCPVGNW